VPWYAYPFKTPPAARYALCRRCDPLPPSSEELGRLDRLYWWLGFLKLPCWSFDRVLRALHVLPREEGRGSGDKESPPVHAVHMLWMAAAAYGEVHVGPDGAVVFDSGCVAVRGPTLHKPGLAAVRALVRARGSRVFLTCGNSWELLLVQCDAEGILIRARPVAPQPAKVEPVAVPA
jgi:hypothetical protein